jgi:IS5 family transposase
MLDTRESRKGLRWQAVQRTAGWRCVPENGALYRTHKKEGCKQDLNETAKAHIRPKVEHPFRVIKQQFVFQKTRMSGLAKNRCKINVLAALSNLFQARHQLLATV